VNAPVSNCIIKNGIVLISISAITGCATAPPTQEMSDARQSVEAAESIGADKHAPVALDSAQQLLSKAQNDLKAGAYKEAQKEALAAREAARQAMAISQAKQVANSESEAAAKTPEQPSPQPRPPAKSAAAAPIVYTVSKNDNLWDIAAKQSVYGDPFLWPLLLKTNVKHIHNADMIPPGLTLMIDPQPSPQDREAARQHAKHRGDTARQTKDASYLHRYGLR
jgi:nucleoid-associated protein YgaU